MAKYVPLVQIIVSPLCNNKLWIHSEGVVHVPIANFER